MYLFNSLRNRIIRTKPANYRKKLIKLLIIVFEAGMPRNFCVTGIKKNLSNNLYSVPCTNKILVNKQIPVAFTKTTFIDLHLSFYSVIASILLLLCAYLYE